ncbi:MAG: putative DNA helicase ino80 [Vezdaea aestivalis]|nr:MAG: putative DNA helicase ino80 [Vezdaea aestivalis]
MYRSQPPLPRAQHKDDGDERTRSPSVNNLPPAQSPRQQSYPSQSPSVPQPSPYSFSSATSPHSHHSYPTSYHQSSPIPLNHTPLPPREKPTSTYYDPTSDKADPNPSWAPSQYNRSPGQPQQNRETFGYVDPNAADQNTYNGLLRSPVAAHSHRQHSPPYSAPHVPSSSRLDPSSHSPNRPIAGSSAIPHNYDSRPTQQSAQEVTQMPKKPARIADPMAFSNILSSSNSDLAHSYSHSAKEEKKPSRVSLDSAMAIDDTPVKSVSRRSSQRKVSPVPDVATTASTNGIHIDPVEAASLPTLKARVDSAEEQVEDIAQAEAIIDETSLSDIDSAEFEGMRKAFAESSKKRMREIEVLEAINRKRRRVDMTEKLAAQLGVHSEAGRQRHRAQHKHEAQQEVQHKEIQDEKERKKDMQRKRRREKTIQNEAQKRDDALAKAEIAKDTAEHDRLLREASRAERKMKTTKRILEGGPPEPEITKELREVTPLAPNLEGGTVDSFQINKTATDTDTIKRKGRGGARPRKSKEQKQAEKEAAEAAQAELDQAEHVQIAPKEEAVAKERVQAKPGPKSKKDTAPPLAPEPYSSKGYNQIYDQIWKDIARRDIPKVYRHKNESLGYKNANLRKTAQLAAKEARRWQLRTNKSMKDVQARAKRSMREMTSFWKRNEREERDMRRMAERQELENAKKVEAERENNRQRRKLDFLISQTELFSHFVGSKVKTDEIERSTDAPDVAAANPQKPAAPRMVLPDTEVGGKVTNFEDLDFGSDNEDELKRAAIANAQHAVAETQRRAQEFNKTAGQQQATDDDYDQGEMNFQNPTSLSDINVTQPKMLNAQLKEYQLKGLNWLANLYDKGINGILADEMGLGKTIQSISAMAYLAENFDIWGPYLVVAPASTLHNWQQEIAKFVPDLKVLPYWGTAKDRKVLRKFWDRKHIVYGRDAPFHVLITSYQLVVLDAQYFQKLTWQYMILDEAQAIKSSASSRWKTLLGFNCRNRLLLTGTPIQNNMQELWALLHFIMPGLFDSHDEFSEWFSKDIESHAQSNTKLNEDQLKRLHLILKPFMLRRIKKHVQKELGDKIETDVYCDLTYRQRAYYTNLRNRISIMDLIEKAAIGDDQDTATLMNLVMQFRKVCNHPDLFERADITSPFSFAYFAETASFLREGPNLQVTYSTRNKIEYKLPRLISCQDGRLSLPGPKNPAAGFRSRYLDHLMNIWSPDNIARGTENADAFSWLRFADTSVKEASDAFYRDIFTRAIRLHENLGKDRVFGTDLGKANERSLVPPHAMFRIADQQMQSTPVSKMYEGPMKELMDVSNRIFEDSYLGRVELCARPGASAPPVELVSDSQATELEKLRTFFNVPLRQALFGSPDCIEPALLESKVEPARFPPSKILSEPNSASSRFTHIEVPSMQRFVTNSGKLARLDKLLKELKEGGHRVLLYFQMTRMIDLMEEYLTQRKYKYLRLDGSSKLEDRRDTVHDFQTRPEIFIFLLSTRAGGLGINLTSADTVIFYDSDWNPTIDSQAMDRAHRLGQTRQVTVYRMITRGTIEERIRKRALQKEEVQRVVIAGGAGGGVDFNTRSRENRTKDIAMWLADDDQAAEIERKEAEIAAQEAKDPTTAGKKKNPRKRKADISLDDMYHEGEGHFDDGSNKPSGTSTPIGEAEPPARGKKGARGGKGMSKKAKTAKERLRIVDGG